MFERAYEEKKPKPKSVLRCDNYLKYAGIHLLLDFWGARNLQDIDFVEKAFRDAIDACGATLLQIKFHHFSPYGGISGVAIVKESHLSIHTWPEYDYAAIDIFVCGDINPYTAIPVLKKYFSPSKVQIMDVKRGIFDELL